jgi:ribosomal protein S2
MKTNAQIIEEARRARADQEREAIFAKLGLTVSTSITNFGISHYIYWHGVKVRISDHDTGIYRMKTEVHFVNQIPTLIEMAAAVARAKGNKAQIATKAAFEGGEFAAKKFYGDKLVNYTQVDQRIGKKGQIVPIAQVTVNRPAFKGCSALNYLTQQIFE